MTVNEERILNIVIKSNGITTSEIAEHLNLDKGTVNSTLQNSKELNALIEQDSSYKWSRKKQKEKKETTVSESDLKRICSYYLNCLSWESTNSVSQFLKSNYELKYVPISGLSIHQKIDQKANALLTKINNNRDLKAYLGYPVKIYTFTAKDGNLYRKIAPVFLFSIEYSGGKIIVDKLPFLNMEVLKAYSDGDSQSLTIEMVALERELGLDVPDLNIEIEEIVSRLVRIRQWDWQETIDPYNIPKTEHLFDFKDGIYNRPIIIETERAKYTEGLESELIALSEMPENSYKNTALYAWVKHTFLQVEEKEQKPLLEVLPLNSEQTDAVTSALNSELTIVTGPPGTGKSQVVTDLLLNIAWNGKNVLFSSKNNKAVDVVERRVNSLSKRPVLLRIGSFQVAARLAEIIKGLLNTRTDSLDRSALTFYLESYQKLSEKSNQLLSQKRKIIDIRNRIDELEQKYCIVRDLFEDIFEIICEDDVGKLENASLYLVYTYQNAIKENNSFFDRLFWGRVSAKRQKEKKEAVWFYNQYASKYHLPSACENLTEEELMELHTRYVEFEKAYPIALEYKNALKSLDSIVSIEEIDKELLQIKKQMSEEAYKLWNVWLSEKKVQLTSYDRQKLIEFVTALELSGDIGFTQNPELRKKFLWATEKLTHVFQCWAVTSLSVKSHIPFVAGLFDYVIIDEASQCDIASILPLLYRAKRAVIIGDPKQLKHIPQISKQLDLELLERYKVPYTWSYSNNSLYDLAASFVDPDRIIQLKDHFRSCSDIIEFSNLFFYDCTLRTATDYAKLQVPNDEKAGIRWLDITGEAKHPKTGSAYNLQEAEAIVIELKKLIDNGYKGSVGVVTPFRAQKELIKKILEKKESKMLSVLMNNNEFIVDTVTRIPR